MKISIWSKEMKNFTFGAKKIMEGETRMIN